MTNLTTRMMIAAATLLIAAGSASAQIMNAEIPFTFRAGSVALPAGTYQVSAVNQLSGQTLHLACGRLVPQAPYPRLLCRFILW